VAKELERERGNEERLRMAEGNKDFTALLLVTL
jgi:hypothetical protein